MAREPSDIDCVQLSIKCCHDLSECIFSMSSSQPTASVPASDRTLSSIKLEILLTLWRIGEALKQVDGEATKLKIRRWEHGIAREVVCILLFYPCEWTSVQTFYSGTLYLRLGFVHSSPSAAMSEITPLTTPLPLWMPLKSSCAHAAFKHVPSR